MRLPLLCLVCVLLAPVFAHAAPATSQPRTWDEKPIAVPLVGSAVAYVPHAPTAHVVLVVSGDDGWNGVVVDVARHLASQAVVIGVPYPPLKRRAVREGGCWYVASDFELISHAAQKTLNLPAYHAPALVGYGAGAAVVYAAVAGGPAVTFNGVVSIGFCPTVDLGVAVCAGDAWTPEYDDRRHLNALPPFRALAKDWWLLQGTEDRVCTVDAARTFIAPMPKAHLAEIAGRTRRLNKAERWSEQLDRAIQDLWTERDVRPAAAQPRSASSRELEDELQRLQLPIEYRWPAQMSALLLFFSGDGGWASLDEETAEHLVTKGIGVIGVSSLRYFWNRKPPAQVAADLRRLVTTLGRSGRPVFAGGFSFGAEVVPVALREWPAADRQALSGLVLVGPGLSASFEIDPLDWVRKPVDNPATRVGQSVRTLALPALCLAGTEEDDSPCPALNSAPGVRVVRLPGSHHFNSDYAAVGDTIASFIRAAAPEKHP